MDLNRVKEIISSEEEVAVHYHGIPVWIDGIDPTSSMATVIARGTHDEKRLVSIDSLVERINRDQ